MIPPIAPLAAVVGASLLGQALFAGSEIAILRANRLLLREEARTRPAAARVLRLLEREDRLLGTCLLGSSLFLVTGAAAFVAALQRLGADVVPWVLALVPLVVVFGETAPRAVARHHANTLAPIVAGPIQIAQRLFAAPLWVLDAGTRGLGRLTGKEERLGVTRQDIVDLLESQRPAGDIAPDEHALIRNVFAIKQTTVEDCMTPLVEVYAVASAAPASRAIAKARESGHSRLMVYRERVDELVGFIDTIDLLFAPREAPVSRFVHRVPIVPETKSADSLLQEMRRQRAHLAIVVDEYGGSVGIVTIEDLVEELLGEIRDEHDDEQAPVRRLSEHEWRADARIEIEALTEVVGKDLPEGDYETVAGLILATVGRIPRPGEVVVAGPWSFRIEEATDRLIRTVHITVT